MDRIAMLAALAAALAACGGGHDDGAVGEVNCADEPRADTYAANMSKAGAGNRLALVLISSDPAPPAMGDNDWLIELVDDGDRPVSGATITVTPFMPDHGHGTPIDVVVTPGEAEGTYHAGPVNLWMPSLWEVTVEADAGGTTDAAVFAFCIEG